MLSHALRAKVQNTALPVPTDPNFKQVSLLLHGDGTNGAQNNTFLDSSTNNFTVTRNGNTTQGTNTPFSQPAGYWSNSFNGTTSYLNNTGNNALDFGTSDFTVEYWAYSNSFSNSPTIIDGRNQASYGNGYADYFTTTGVFHLYLNNSDVYASSQSISTNTWFHIAVVRISGQISVYINGTKSGSSFTLSGSLGAPDFRIGRNNSSGYWNGFVSNIRIVKGTAVYTANFTPPTTPLTAITNTSLLTCQSNNFKDNSSNNFTVTATGTPSVQPFSPFAPTAAYSTSVNGGSMYFDGSDHLTAPSNAALTFGTGDFCYELWVYHVTSGTATTYGDQSANGFALRRNASNQLVLSQATVAVLLTTTATIPINEWTHLAATRNGTTVNLFINGVVSATATLSTDFSSTSTWFVGRNSSSAVNFMNGYISDVRAVKGSAVYTAAFTPPTAPLTAITNTSLLLNGINAGIFDNAEKNNLETVGNAQISTSVTKFGTGSMSFDGTGDWLTAPDSVNLQLVTGNFTIEGWVYLNAIGSARGFVSKGTSTTGWSLGANSSNQVVFSYASSTITSTGTLAVSTWYFVTVVREGTGTNQTKIYINGTNDGTGTVSTNFNQTNIMYVGADRVGGSALNGYIDDLRITKGVARYTANFTAPTAAFPNQ